MYALINFKTAMFVSRRRRVRAADQRAKHNRNALSPL